MADFKINYRLWGMSDGSVYTVFWNVIYQMILWKLNGGKMIVFGPSLNFTDGYFCKVQESSSVNCFHLNCEIELLTHMNLCEQGGLEGRDHVCVACVCVLLFSQCERTCCFGKRMDPRSGWTLFPWTDSAVCVCLCVRACVCVSLGSRLREWESRRGTDQFPFYCGRAETWDAWPPVTQIHSSFLLCCSSLAKWRNIRWRERQKRTDEREWVEEEGKGDGVGSLLIMGKKRVRSREEWKYEAYCEGILWITPECSWEPFVHIKNISGWRVWDTWTNSKVSDKRNIAEVCCKVMETELHHPGERVFNKHAAVM